MRKTYLPLIVLLVALLQSFEAGAATYYTCANGNASNAAIWSTVSSAGPTCNCFPASTDDVVIDIWTVTLDVPATAHNVTLKSGTLILAAPLSLTGNWTNNGGTLTPGAFAVDFTGAAGTQTINGTAAAQSFYDLTIAKTAGQILTVGGSTTTLTVTHNFTETTGNFTAGTAINLNIGANLTVSAGTFSTSAGTLLTFNGATTSTIIGAGTFTFTSATTLVLNKSARATLVDIQTANFYTGLNGGGNNFTLTMGTLKFNNAGTLNDMHTSGIATTLTIPANVVLDVESGTVNLCTGASVGQPALSGELLINGGTVNVSSSVSASDMYYFAGASLYVNGGTLNLYSGLGYNAIANDYLDFNMTAGTINVALGGASTFGFNLNNLNGGKTKMSGGLIMLQCATASANTDLDFGGGAGLLTTPANYAVTGGTVRFGSASTPVAGNKFGMAAYANSTYPNIVVGLLGGGVAVTASPGSPGTLEMLSLTISDASATFDCKCISDNSTGNPINITGNDGSAGNNTFINNGTFTARSTLISFVGAVSQTIGGTSATTFHDIAMGGSGAVTLSTSITCRNLTFNALGSAVTLTHSGITNPTLTSTGTVTINQPTAAVTTSWNINGGTGTTAAITFVGSNATAGRIAQIAVTSGSLSASGTAAFDAANLSAANQVISVATGSLTFSNTFTLGAAAGNSGTLSVTGAGTINFNAATALNYDNTRAPVFNTASGSTLNFKGSITGTGGGSLTFHAASNAIFIASGTVTPGTTTLTFGNLQINATKTLTAAGNFNVAGASWANNGTFTPSTFTVTFNGAVAQQILGTAATKFYNLTLSNALGLSLAPSAGLITTATHNMNFTAGKVTLGNFEFDMGAAATISTITGYSSSSYFITNGTGTLKIFNVSNVAVTPAVFPVGFSTTSYEPITLTPGTGTADNYRVGVSQHVLANGTSGAAFANNVVDWSWTVTSQTNNGTLVNSLTPTWNGADELTNFDRTNSSLSYYNAGWTSFTPTGAAATGADPYTQPASTTGITPVLGGITTAGTVYAVGSNGVLPIELTSFTANLQSDAVLLKWQTSSETNNDYFTIEKSHDGINYTLVGTEKGAGNSSETRNYSMTDLQPFDGTSYYRLKQTDFNGHTQSFSPVAINRKNTGSFEVFPNPSDGENLFVKLSGDISNREILVVVYDMQGKETYSKITVTGQTDELLQAIDPASKLAKGVYIIVATSENLYFRQRVVIQ